MQPRVCIFSQFALAMCLLVPATSAQKPPAPAPPPPPPSSGQPPSGGGPGQPTGPFPSANSPQPGVLREDLIQYLMGHVATSDGTALPTDVKVERICNARVRQQIYVNTHGDFSMELGSMNDTLVDASADGGSTLQDVSRFSGQGIPRRELANCELQASLAGFRSEVINLVNLDPFGNTVDVGQIVVERRTKVQGNTLSAEPYKAPKDARKAYERGMDAEKNGKLSAAQQYFEKAVQIYPKYTSAWFQLGSIFMNQNQSDAARKALTQATLSDARFLPPYVSLSLLAYQAGNWDEVLRLTGHILQLDPLNYNHVSGYVLDLDPFDYAQAYFYNAAANFNLNRLAEAERSCLKAETLDVRPRFPRLHLLLAEIFARETNYDRAISEIKIYLELVPQAKDVELVRQRLSQLEKLNNAAS